MARSKDYDSKGKSHLLHMGVNKEREFILNWFRNEYKNTSEGIWIALANHIEHIEKYRSKSGYVPSWKKKKKKKMTAQEKFFALIRKWG